MIAVFLIVLVLLDPLTDLPVLQTRVMQMADLQTCMELAAEARAYPLVIHAGCVVRVHP